MRYFSESLANTTDKFFESVKRNNIEQAYQLFSAEFREHTSLQDLQKFVEENSLNNYQHASWGSRSQSHDSSQLSATVTTQTGRLVPLLVGFIKKQSSWKIDSIHKPTAGLADKLNNAHLPDTRELTRLIKSAVQQFAVSVNQKSMAAFHQNVAIAWQNQISVADLDIAYDAFYDAGVDLTVLKNFEPKFDQPSTLDQYGAFLVAGIYPTQPRQLQFKQSYIYEGLSWKLVGFSADIK